MREAGEMGVWRGGGENVCVSQKEGEGKRERGCVCVRACVCVLVCVRACTCAGMRVHARVRTCTCVRACFSAVTLYAVL